MKHLKTFLATLAISGLSVSPIYAENVNQLQFTIANFAHGGNGKLFTSISGNTLTVTGNVTGATNTPALNIDNGVTVLWKASYEGTANYPDLLIALFNTGTFEVAAGGSIKNTGDYYAIENDDANSKIVVSGGTVVGGIISRGNITVSSGSVIAEKNICAIQGYGESNTYITISGGTVTSNRDVIYVYNTCNLVISGGVLKNTGIYKDPGIRISGDPTVTVSGGMILSKWGYAISNEETGIVNFNGGICFAYGTSVTDVINGVYNSNNKGVIAAWNKAAGTTSYVAGTNDDIFIFPSSIPAKWAKAGGVSGIRGSSGTTGFGFIPVEGVTVEEMRK